MPGETSEVEGHRYRCCSRKKSGVPSLGKVNAQFIQIFHLTDIKRTLLPKHPDLKCVLLLLLLLLQKFYIAPLQG